MKIVLNKCYGGFGLSHEAFLRLREMGNKHALAEADVGETWHDGSGPRRSFGSFLSDIPRDDQQLVAVVEELSDKAAGAYAKLRIVDVPDGAAWEINEYDGMETAREPSRFWG
jgi:hypothetical protein